MTISLNSELQKFVEEKVRSGHFASADEAVNSLLSFVKEQEELSPEELESLRADVAVGLEQADRGELQDWDPDEIWNEVARRQANDRPAEM
jgi:antitoxin ParD1/3/4